MVKGEDWNDDELRASVQAYLDMLRHHRQGLPYIKKQYYRDLAGRFGRSEKSFEYRAQNISQVLALQGREWLPGLVPAKNVGPRVTAQIEQLLAELESVSNLGTAAFESQVHAARQHKPNAPPKGRRNPTPREGKVTTYDRDPEVKAWVLNAANGICEACKQPAPFTNVNNEQYLEVHHVRQLADGGSDTITNSVAICPNCHRALHYSRDKLKLIATLYSTVSRLAIE